MKPQKTEKKQYAVKVYRQLQRTVLFDICTENLVDAQLIDKGKTKLGKPYEQYLLKPLNRFDNSAADVFFEFLKWQKNESNKY